MTHELILTSAAQGLESEGGGFCVVAADNKFPESLIENLFQISDYRYHSQDPDDLNQNAIIYSHTIIKPTTTPSQSSSSSSSFPILPSFVKKPNNALSEPIWHVLSRIAPSGKDYQDKPNRLAHHIVLNESELVVEGPAWLLALAGFHFTQWYTPPINFPLGRPIPTISLYGIPPQTCRQKIARERLKLDPQKMSINPRQQINAETIRQIIQINEEQIASADFPTSPCSTWKNITGDAGWGGVLAESARNIKEAAIIYPQGTNLLPLFVESLAILPAQFLWNTTFTTFYIDPKNNIDTNKPATNKNFRQPQKTKQNSPLLNMPYQWKGVVKGSPEAEILKNRNDILIIDLTRKPVESPEGIFVKFATTGDENNLPFETLQTINSESNAHESADTIIDPINPQTNNANKSTTSVLSTNSNAESNPNTTDSKTSESLNLANIKFEPNTEPANLSLSAQATTTSNSAATTVDSQTTIQPPPIPNIVINDSTNAKNKISPTTQNASKILNRALRALSKNQFYLIYAVALAIIVGLLILVIDQITGFGTVQSLFGQKKSSKIIDAKPPTIIVQPITTNDIDEEEKKKKDAENAKAEKQRKLEETLLAINKKRKEDTAALDKYIRQFNFPPYLPLTPPTIKENRIIVPKNYSICTNLTGLHQYGSALKLEWISLWDFNDRKIETRKLKFNLNDPKDQDNSTDQEDQPTDSDKMSNDNSPKKQSHYRFVHLIDDNNHTPDKPDNNPDNHESDDQIVFPDPNRFEWEVVAIIQNNKTKNNNDNNSNPNDKNDNANNDANKITEVKLFHLKLEENGLHIKWERSGLLPAYFYDTLRVSLGFLRFSVEQFVDSDESNESNESNESKESNDSGQFEYFVQLFEPQLVSPISPHTVFNDKTTQFPVLTPLAITPWESLFSNSDYFEYKFNLEVKVKPETITDVLTEIKKAEQSQSAEINFTTKKVEAKRKKLDELNNSIEEYFPLQTKFTADTETTTITWTDSFNAELELLQKNIETTKLESKQVKNELEQVTQKSFNIGADPNKAAEERKELDAKTTELEQKSRELSNNDFELNSRIKNLPESHKVVMSNKEIQFDYSVYLTSGKNKRELLIMTTSNNKINEKINKKPR